MPELTLKKEALSSSISKILTTSNKGAVKEEIALGWLDTKKTCVLTKTKIEIGETWHTVGNEVRKDYENTESGRAELELNVPEPYLSAVLAVWGDNINE